MTRRGPGKDAVSDLPAGYVAIRSPAARWIARPECAEELGRGEGDRLLLGRARRDKRPGSGRGSIVRMPLGGVPAIGKRALHGGLAGPILGGLYCGRGRLLAQIRAAHRLHEAGIPTPELLAVGWRPVFRGLSAHAILTRALPEAENLFEAAQHEAPWRRRRAILGESAALVRAMHDIGFMHPDLNVTNLVLGATESGDRIHVVDLDRGRFVSQTGLSERTKNLRRLVRSYRKWIRGRWPLSPREEIYFLRRYCRADRAFLRALLARLGRR